MRVRQTLGSVLRVSLGVAALFGMTAGQVRAQPAPPHGIENTVAAVNQAPDPTVQAAFVDLRAAIAAVPDAVLNGGQKRSLTAKVEAAEAQYNRSNICPAFNQLNALGNELQAIRKQGGAQTATAESLFAQGRMLRDSLFDPSSGQFPPDPCFRGSSVQPPSVRINASDNRHFGATVGFGSPLLQPAAGGGESWTQLSIPGLDVPMGAPGQPAIPSWQGLVGIPAGAQATLRMTAAPVVAESFLINLYPSQPQPLDADTEEPAPSPLLFADRPFVKDARVYSTDVFLPPGPCAFKPLGQYRDLQMGQVQCNAGQYNPMTDEYRAFSSVSFDIEFTGGSGAFITSQTFSPFEVGSSSTVTSVLNSGAVVQFFNVADYLSRICFGEELLLLTHTNFRAAADTLATWKRDKGISTTVINVGSGTPYDTAAKIDDLIEDRYDDCVVRPSYVLLLGDSEFIPPHALDYDVDDDSTTGSDLGYAVYVQVLFDAFFPDFAVGRIPVDTLAEANTVVNKVVQYESNPPFVNFGTGGPFYTNASIASQFQCCRMNQNGTALNNQAGTDQRSFIQTSETVRNTIQGAGKTVQRIYTRTTDTGGYCLVNQNPCPNGQMQQAYSGNATPNRYYNGTLLPSDLRSGSGFAWSGSTQNIIDAFNAGRFLMVHRDHGGASGWVNPSFGTSNLGSLTNGALLPFLYSVNCKSGYFDAETDAMSNSESFMEQILLMSGGGIVGGLGDVRNSPTWANSALLRGFVDATWPGLAPEYGTNTSKRRLGDILNHGKVYLLTQVGVAQPAGSVSLDDMVDEYIMWHAFGDPTLEMWTSNPHRLVLGDAFTLAVQADRLRVQYATEGATLTAFQETELGVVPVGRAMVKGGVAELPFFKAPDPQLPILLSASMENTVSKLLTARVTAKPDLIVESLALTTSTLFPGQSLESILTVRVGNLGAAAAPGTINPDGTLEAPGVGYMVDLVLSSDTSMPAGFANLPLPAGVAFAEDGLLQGGRISRTPDVAAASAVVLSPAPPINSDVGGVVPSQIPSGNFNLCARIDPGNAVAESNEDNNVKCVPVTIFVREIPPRLG